jgi:hypothetical protein
LTTYPRVYTLSLSSGVVLLTMDDIKALLSLWYLHTCGVESMVIYDKHCITSTYLAQTTVRGSRGHFPPNYFSEQKKIRPEFHVTRSFDSRESESLFTSHPSTW